MRRLAFFNTRGLLLGLMPLAIPQSALHNSVASVAQVALATPAPGGADAHAARSIPVRRLVGSYVLTQHKSDPLPALVHTDSLSTELLIGGTIEIQQNSQFTLRYTTRTTMRGTGQVEDAPVELTGRVSPTPAGLRLTIMSDNGEPSEEPWSVNATVTKRLQLVVTFDDGDLETLSFRKR